MSGEAPQTGTYVYCVASAEPLAAVSSFQSTPIGSGAEPVRTVQYEDLVAVVSTSPNIRYTLRREYLRAHESVLEETMRYTDVLPVAFGTVARDDRQVRDELLTRRFDELHEYLDYVRGRVEQSVKAHWNPDRVFAEIVAGDEQLAALRDSVTTLPEDASYYDRIELGKRTEEAIAAKRARESEALLQALEPLAVDTRVNEDLTDMMVLNAAFLVDKSQEQRFDETIRELAAREEDRLYLQHVGPLPPYNFVSIHVRWGE